MAMKTKSKTAPETLKRLATDAELREHALEALQSVRKAVEETREQEQKISRKAQKKLKKASKQAAAKSDAVKAEIGEVVEAATSKAKTESAKTAPAKAAPAKKKRHPVRNLLFVATIGAVVALVVSEDARKVVLDALFGAEEEFEYTSSTTAKAGASTNGAS